MNAGKLLNLTATVGALLLVCSCTVSCKSKEPGAKEMADNLKTHLEMNLVEGISRVTCPPNAKQKKGAKFDCKVHFAKGKVWNVTMHWVDHALFKAYLHLDKKEMEQDLAARIKKAYKTDLKSVTCPDKMLHKEGNTYTCTAVDPKGVEAKFNLIVDKKGRRWEPAKKAGQAKTPVKKPAAPDKKPEAPKK